MSARESEKLTRQKVAGMGRDNIEKARFFFGVAERLQGVEMCRCNIHSVRIPAVISRSSRMRRRRDASSGRLYSEKPAAAFAEIALRAIFPRCQFEINLPDFQLGGFILDPQIGDGNLAVDELEAVPFRNFALARFVVLIRSERVKGHDSDSS